MGHALRSPTLGSIVRTAPLLSQGTVEAMPILEFAGADEDGGWRKREGPLVSDKTVGLRVHDFLCQVVVPSSGIKVVHDTSAKLGKRGSPQCILPLCSASQAYSVGSSEKTTGGFGCDRPKVQTFAFSQPKP